MTRKAKWQRPRVRHVRIEVMPCNDSRELVYSDSRELVYRWVCRCKVDNVTHYSSTKRTVVAYARDYAHADNKRTGRCFSIRIKNRDGTYADEITIPRSSDPFPPRG